MGGLLLFNQLDQLAKGTTWQTREPATEAGRTARVAAGRREVRGAREAKREPVAPGVLPGAGVRVRTARQADGAPARVPGPTHLRAGLGRSGRVLRGTTILRFRRRSSRPIWIAEPAPN